MAGNHDDNVRGIITSNKRSTVNIVSFIASYIVAYMFSKKSLINMS